MKTLAILILTILVAATFGPAADAAMSIEVDFYGGTTTLVQGQYDTGNTIALVANQDWVMVDIVASRTPDANGLTSTSWVLNFDPTQLQISNLAYGGKFYGVLIEEIDNLAGLVKLEALATVPLTGEVLLGTFRIDCKDISIDELFIKQLKQYNNLLRDDFDYSVQYPADPLATIIQVSVIQGDFDNDGDVDGVDQAILLDKSAAPAFLPVFAEEFGRNDNP